MRLGCVTSKNCLSNVMHSLLNKLAMKLGFMSAEKVLRELGIWKTTFVPPGHYYSPLNDLDYIRIHESRLFNKVDINLAGIELNHSGQVDLLHSLAKHYPSIIFPEQQQAEFRYYYRNQWFSFSDAIFLASMLLHYRPGKVIEVGSGFSSAVMLDVNERYLGNSAELLFIEPYPEDRLAKLVRPGDRYRIRREFIQDVPLEVFDALGENDLLFIDTSHVSKTGSDVNHLLFQVLPRLRKGVLVHLHDVFYPFEYPKEWVLGGRAWNEAYLVRAFLQYNSQFRIELFTSYLEHVERTWISQHMPLCLNRHEEWKDEFGRVFLLDTTGQSIYLRRV